MEADQGQDAQCAIGCHTMTLAILFRLGLPEVTLTCAVSRSPRSAGARHAVLLSPATPDHGSPEAVASLLDHLGTGKSSA